MLQNMHPIRRERSKKLTFQFSQAKLDVQWCNVPSLCQRLNPDRGNHRKTTQLTRISKWNPFLACRG
jgi:hypothetical protein